MLLSVIDFGYWRFPQVNMAEAYEFEDLWLDAFSLPLPPNSVIFTGWEKHTSLIYYPTVAGYRSDLTARITEEKTMLD